MIWGGTPPIFGNIHILYTSNNPITPNGSLCGTSCASCGVMPAAVAAGAASITTSSATSPGRRPLRLGALGGR